VPRPERPRVPLPAGYRQGILAAITVFLGFSLLFLRFWSFEAPGHWTTVSVIALVLLAIAIMLELITLWRSLQVADDDEIEYKKTLRWFLLSIVMLVLSLLAAGLDYTELLQF
jgi:hypothetical protein